MKVTSDKGVYEMSLFSDFSEEVIHTMQLEHDLVMELSKNLRLLEARVKELEQKQ